MGFRAEGFGFSLRVRILRLGFRVWSFRMPPPTYPNVVWYLVGASVGRLREVPSSGDGLFV